MNGATANLSPGLTAILVELESRMGFELTLTSGYRTPEHNEAVGGVTDSEHTDDPANGADVLCKRGITRWKMLKHLFDLGVSRIGLGKDFIHIGVSSEKPQQVAWEYYHEP